MRKLLFLILLLCPLAFGQVDAVQVQQDGVSKGQVAGGIARFNFSGCSVAAKSSNSWAINCSQQGTSIPSGLLAFVVSGTCPTGWTEVTALSGKFIQFTTAANGDVGTTGGNSTITPTGSVAAPTFTGDTTTVPAETVASLSAAAQTFTGDTTTVPAETVSSLTAAAQTISGSTATEAAHTHSVTSNVTGTITPGGTVAWPAGVPTQAADTFGTTKFTTNSSGSAAFTSETARGAISWPAGVPTFTGTTSQSVSMTNNPVTSGAGSSHSHGVGTLVNASSAVTGTLNSTSLTPLGHNAASSVTGTLNSTSITPLGHNSAPAFTGNAIDPSPPYFKVIPCSKN